MNIEPQIIGYIAGTLSAIGSIPQAVKVLRTPNTKAISAITYFLVTICVILWLAYGIGMKNYPVIFTNAAMLPFVLIVFLKKMHNLMRGVD